MSQKGFAPVLILLIVVAIIGVAGVAFYSKSKLENKQQQTYQATNGSTAPTAQENKKSFFGNWGGAGGGGACQGVTPPKQNADGAFTNAITDITSIDHITNGSGTGDSRFTYLWIKDKKEIPVFAPADGVLTYIAYKTRADLDPSGKYPDYDLAFLVDCHTLFRINHITKPIDEIVKTDSAGSAFAINVGKPIPEDQTKPIATVNVKAGQQIGVTTGTSNAHNFDFGIFVDNAATCPYSKFEDPIKTDWLNLFRGVACQVSGNY